MSKVLPQLYIGSIKEISDKKWIDKHNISHVVNCAIELDNYFPDDVNYLNLHLRDAADQTLYHVFEPAYKFIYDAISKGGTVMVHCYAGVSRSASIVIYFLMKSQKVGLQKALEQLKSVRPIINPNHGFMHQLLSVTPEYRNQMMMNVSKPITRGQVQKNGGYHPYMNSY